MAVEGQVFSCSTTQDWKDQFEKEKNSQRLVVVDFTASWCGPCRFIAPVLNDFAKKYTHVCFLKVDVDELRDVAEEYQVEAMPTFKFMKQGKVIHTVMGARKEELMEAIERHASMTVTSTA